MISLRPFKSCDAILIAEWLKDENVYIRWGGDRIGKYPLTAECINDKYTNENGDCTEPDNFYPWTAVDENGNAAGSFIMRYTGGNRKQLRFGWVVVNESIRGKGIGGQMIRLGLKYAFEILGVERITIGVFEDNLPARSCYQKAGFSAFDITKSGNYSIIEMEIGKEHYFKNS